MDTVASPLDNTRPIAMLDDVGRDGYHPGTRARIETGRGLYQRFHLAHELWGNVAKELSKRGFVYNPMVQTVLVPRPYVSMFEALISGGTA